MDCSFTIKANWGRGGGGGGGWGVGISTYIMVFNENIFENWLIFHIFTWHNVKGEFSALQNI